MNFLPDICPRRLRVTMKKNEFNLLTYRPTKASKTTEISFGANGINWSLILKGTFVGSFGLVMLCLAIQENLFVPEILLGMTIVFMLLLYRTSFKDSFSMLKTKNPKSSEYGN